MRMEDRLQKSLICHPNHQAGMSNFSYRTLKASSRGSYKEKGSRFLAFAFPVNSESAIRAHLEDLRREYFDARHHCYAWMLGAEKQRYRAADDGEPAHSAGDPILGQIRSHDITNVLIVVVRYFGGVKLGVGGLITAYREAASDALRSATVIEEEVMASLKFTYPYDRTPDLMRMIKDFGLQVTEQTFGEHCVLHTKVALRNNQALQTKVRLLNIHTPTILVDSE